MICDHGRIASQCMECLHEAQDMFQASNGAAAGGVLASGDAPHEQATLYLRKVFGLGQGDAEFHAAQLRDLFAADGVMERPKHG